MHLGAIAIYARGLRNFKTAVSNENLIVMILPKLAIFQQEKNQGFVKRNRDLIFWILAIYLQI